MREVYVQRWVYTCDSAAHRAVGFVMAGILLAACTTAPSGVARRVSIVPAISSLYVGETTQMSAVVQYEDGAMKDSPATWTVAGDSVRHQGAGKFIGATSGVAVIRASVEGQMAERELEVVPNIMGLWSGVLHHDTCNRISGEGPGHCSKNTFGTTYTMQIEVSRQTGNACVLEILLRNLNRGVIAASLRHSGTLAVSEGEVRGPGELGDHVFRLKDWSVKLQSTDGSSRLIGTLTMEYQFVNSWGPQSYREDATISLERQ